MNLKLKEFQDTHKKILSSMKKVKPLENKKNVFYNNGKKIVLPKVKQFSPYYL